MILVIRMTLFWLCSFVVCVSAFAGNDSGGGFAIQINKINYLQDFVESGIERSAHIPDLDDQMGAFEVLKKTGLRSNVASGVSNKLNQIYLKSPDLANLLLNTLVALEWSTVETDIGLPDDNGWSPIKLDDGKTLYPAALRNNEFGTVTIRGSIVNAMPLSNLVGLVFHEVVRYYIHNWFKGMDRAYVNRTFVSYLFRPQFDINTSEDVIAKFHVMVLGLPVVPGQNFMLSYDDFMKFYAPQAIASCGELKTKHNQAILDGLSALAEIVDEVGAFSQASYDNAKSLTDESAPYFSGLELRFASQEWSINSIMPKGVNDHLLANGYRLKSMSDFYNEYVERVDFAGSSFFILKKSKKVMVSLVTAYGRGAVYRHNISPLKISLLISVQDRFRTLKRQYDQPSIRFFERCVGDNAIEVESFISDRVVL